MDESADLDDPDEEEENIKPKKIPNQFNFSERAALTYPIPLRVS
jgi:dynein intermediate chain 1